MVKDNQSVHICGWNATGKGVVMKLLDGHPQLAVMPFHDSLASALSQIDDPDEFRNSTDPSVFDIGAFYKSVARSNCRYHLIQASNHGRPLRLTASVDNPQGESFENFDFYKFENDWVSRVNAKEEFLPKEIILEIYHSFFTHWERYPYDSEKCKYFVGLEGRDIEGIRFILEEMENSKVIFMTRDPRGCVASKGNKDISGSNVIEYLKRGKIHEISKLNERVRALSEEYPNKIQILSFEDVILNTDSSVEVIRDFLNIEEDKILSRPTVCGSELQDVNYLGEINDRWEDLLTDREIDIANLQMGESGIFDVSPSVWPGYAKMELMWRMEKYVEAIGINPLAKKVRDRIIGSKFYP